MGSLRRSLLDTDIVLTGHLGARENCTKTEVTLLKQSGADSRRRCIVGGGDAMDKQRTSKEQAKNKQRTSKEQAKNEMY
jgi:hypothetical protein